MKKKRGKKKAVASLRLTLKIVELATVAAEIAVRIISLLIW
jgi:hypothetical protein